MRLPSFVKFLKRSGRAETVFVFDIGSASVGGAIVELSSGKPPVIRFSVRKDIPFQEDLDLKRFIKQMLATLETVATALAAETTLQRASGAAAWPTKAIAILTAPWYASSMRTMRLEREVPFSVSPRQLADAIENEVGKFKKALNADYADKGLAHPKLEVIESISVGIKLNGYPTEKPYGRSSRQFEATLFISVSPHQIIEGIKEKIELICKADIVALRSFSLAYFDAMRDLNAGIRECLLVDLSGEVTEIAHMREGVLVQTVSFPLGKNYLIRALMLERNTTAADIFSQLALFSSRDVDDSAAEKLHRSSEKLAAEWIAEFKKAAEVLANGLLLPSDIVLAADQDVLDWFAEALRNEPPEGLFSNKPIQLHPLDRAFFKESVMFSGAHPTHDSFLAADALFVSKIVRKI